MKPKTVYGIDRKSTARRSRQIAETSENPVDYGSEMVVGKSLLLRPTADVEGDGEGLTPVECEVLYIQGSAAVPRVDIDGPIVLTAFVVAEVEIKAGKLYPGIWVGKSPVLLSWAMPVDICKEICKCDVYATDDECGDPPPPDPECGTCDWVWTDGTWILQGNDCGEDCDCQSEPGLDGTFEGETHSVACEPTDCSEKGCTYEWYNGAWRLIETRCTEGCICSNAPTDPGQSQYEVVTVPCISGDPPGYCGSCVWTWNGTAFDSPDNSGCTGDCECGDPPDPSEGAGMEIGQPYYADCESASVPPCQCLSSCGLDLGQEVVVRASITAVFTNGTTQEETTYTYFSDGLPYAGCGLIFYGTADGTTQGPSFQIFFDGDANGWGVSGPSGGGGGNGTYTGCTPPESISYDEIGSPNSWEISFTSDLRDCTPAITGIGDEFSKRHRKWVSGCSCKKGVIAVMNRWKPGEVTPEKIERVARTLHAKISDRADLQTIIDAINEVVQ